MAERDAKKVAEGLTEAQRAALVQCVDVLNGFAGEGLMAEVAGRGYVGADDALYDLAVAFDMDDRLEYTDWVRDHLRGEQ